MHQLWDTADNIWIGIGDKTHSDTNYYKTHYITRCDSIINNVWVSDKGNEVDEFNDRRINDALKPEKLKSRKV